VNEIKTNVDSVIGQEGIVTSSIMSNGIGRIKLRSQEWSAIADESIEIGQRVRVLDVEGNKLIVKKI
jgi:membrane protein implicated in regulation of membrane protease activity